MMDDKFIQALEKALPAGFDLGVLRQEVAPGLWESNPMQAALYAISASNQFNAEDYLRRYPDVARSGIDPVLHFVKYGIWENRHFNLAGSARATSLAPQCAKNGDRGPAVSVLVPVYNNACYLRQCIDSIITQTLRNLEIIIINDGSTDPEAVSIMEEYEHNDPRVILINKPNTGYGHTLNTGLRYATGEYIAIVESDDQIHPEAYQLMYAKAKIFAADVVKTDYDELFGFGMTARLVRKRIMEDKSKYDFPVSPWHDLSLFMTNNVIWNGIYQTSFLKQNDIRFNETPGAAFQDNGFWFQTYIHAHRMLLLDTPTYIYRQDNPVSSMFNTGKIYAMSNEYQFILDKLLADQQLYNRFIGVFHYKRFNNYLFTLQRILPEYRRLALQHYANEFNEAMRKGEIDQTIFQPHQYKAIQAICRLDYDCSWMPHPDVSVILPIFNGGKYLEATMESIMSQTYANIEIICVNDGSSDGSLAKLQAFYEKDKRIRLFSQPNQGAGKARNTGLAMARGEYVFFLDADDIYKPDMFENMIGKMRKTGADFCVCRSASRDEATGSILSMDYSLLKPLLPRQETFKACDIKDNIFMAFAGWSWDKVYKKSFIDRHRLKFQEIKSSNDMFFVFAALVLADKITICDNELVIHRDNVKGSIAERRYERPLVFISALAALQQLLREQGLYERYFPSFISYAMHFYSWHLSSLKGEAACQIKCFKDMFCKYFGVKQMLRLDSKRLYHKYQFSPDYFKSI